ncbi:hypothetical protein ACI65C_005848 [Semiaphis heraclei]
MPNKYKKLLGSRKYKNYSDETLQKCLSEIKNKTITQREAERAYGISHRTINYKLKNLHNLKIGRPTVFADNEEKSFVDHIIVMSNYGFPIDKTDLGHIVKSFLDRLGREPTMVTTLQNGFRKCGIYPCDQNELLESLPDSKFKILQSKKPLYSI